MTDDKTLYTARTLPFSPEEIYSAFASSDLLAEWWGPEGFTNTFDLFEFWPGGRWVFVMHAPDGTDYANTSTFENLEPNANIVIHHDCPPQFRLTIGLKAQGRGTHVTWTQVFENAQTARAVRERAGPANEQNLDRLTRVLEQAGSAV